MAESILQTFLNNQFINTDNTEHIEGLEKATTEVIRLLKLKKNKPLIIPYTLVALDPTISDSDVVVQEVQAIIIKKWKAFKNSVNKLNDAPITYIRAVILNALQKLSDDETYAGIIWHTSCKIINHYQLVGEQEVLENFIQDIGNKVENIAQTEWDIVEAIQVKPIRSMTITPPAINQGLVDQVALQAHLTAATVYQGVEGGENPTYNHNDYDTWPVFFSKRAAEGLTKEINATLSAQKNSLTSVTTKISKSVSSYFGAIQPYLQEVSSSLLQNSQSLKKRSDLIWWKQSLYSSRLSKSYRTLDPLSIAITMPTDLADQVSPIYPTSVDYFLLETQRDVLGKTVDEERDLVQLIGQLSEFSDEEKNLLDHIQLETTGRKMLGSYLADILNDEINKDQLFAQTGIDKKTKISLQELTVWLFHDLQASALISEL